MISYGSPIDRNRNDPFLVIVGLEFVLTEQFPLENAQHVPVFPSAKGVEKSFLAMVEFLLGQFPEAVVFEGRKRAFLPILPRGCLNVGAAGKEVK